MKRKFFYALIGTASMFIVNTTTAQISKGSLLLGGNLGFTSAKDETGVSEVKRTTFNISPALGVAIQENRFLGGDLNFGSNVRDANGAKTTSTNFGVGAFLRQYQPIGTKGFYLFGQARLGADITKEKEAKRDGLSVGLGLTPGISYAVTKKVHLETSLANLFYAGYSSDKIKDTDIKSSSFGAAVNLGQNTTWNVGIRVLLAK